MVALNPQDDGGLFGVVSNVCDALVGPLRGLFSFSGVNGESKEALVAWGLGALGYLVLGLFAQSFLRDVPKLRSSGDRPLDRDDVHRAELPNHSRELRSTPAI